ncbi:TMV resistance protein N-like isoform X2 [Senna tora]|uniref:TMV resistance protein N-like isoform X2 n=1 Tax=Senna tora TaxID=362788 RepID=A0A834TR90_9FABA|nr:TMV resistance protein N-like isoform X2 [Senna tora]
MSSSSSSSLVSIDEPNPSVLSHILDELPRLQSLCMTCGSDSQLTQGVERILSTLYAANSTELETISSQSSSSSSNMAIMETEGDALLSVCCSSQVHKLASKNSLGCFLLQVGRSDQVTNTLTQSIISQVQKFTTTNRGYGDCSDLPGDNYPKWVTFNGKGPSVLFQVPQVSNCTLRRMILCIIYSSCSGYHDTTKVINGSNNNIINNVLIINHSKKTIKLYKRETLASSDDDGDCERILSSFQPCEKVEIYVVSGFGLILKKTSVYLIYGESSSSSEGKLLLEFSHEVDHDEFASISNIGDENECVNPARTTMSKAVFFRVSPYPQTTITSTLSPGSRFERVRDLHLRWSLACRAEW